MTAKYFDTPFAISGDVSVIPTGVQPDGSVSYTQGFPVKYSTAVASGGLNVPRTPMNELFYEITLALQQYQQHGTPDYYAAIGSGGAGYSKYDRVRYSNGKTYQSRKDSNTDLPTVTASWSLDNPSSEYALDTGAANAYVIALAPPITSYYDGLVVYWKVGAGNTSTGASTLNAGGGAVALLNDAGGAIQLNDLVAASIITSIFDAGANSFYVTEVLASQNVASIAETTVTGASHTYVTAEQSHLVVRSNSASAMTDTLPGTAGTFANGWFNYIKNADASASLTVAVGAGGTINQGNLTGSLVIEPGETWLVECQGVGVYNAGRIHSATLHASAPGGAFKKLSVAWSSTTAVALTADEVIVEDTNLNTRRISSVSLTLGTGTSGANGLDTGALAASTWYYLWAIFNPSTNTQAILMSLSSTAPTMPSGYTYKALLSAIFLDGSNNIMGFKQLGREYQWVVGSNLSTARAIATGASGNPSTPTFTATSISNFIPTPVASVGKFYLNDASGSNSSVLAPNASYGGLSSATNTPPLMTNAGAISSSSGEFVLETTNVYYASGGGTTAYCLGFRLNI